MAQFNPPSTHRTADGSVDNEVVVEGAVNIGGADEGVDDGSVDNEVVFKPITIGSSVVKNSKYRRMTAIFRSLMTQG